MFDLLVKVGLKEIEVGFPSAGATEFDFISGLIREDRIPEDVTIQVLTQSRRDLIERSFESLEGARTAIVHLYNAVSPAWRKIVFGMTRDEVRQIAVEGAKILRDEAAKRPNTDWFFEYSPETFSTAELDFGRGLRRRHGRAEADARPSADPEPARHRRVRDAQRLCRPDRMVRAQHRTVIRWSSRSTRITTEAPASPPPSWA